MISFKKNSIGIYVSDDQNYVYFEDKVYKFVESRLGSACCNCDIHDTKVYNNVSGLNCSLDFPCQSARGTGHLNLRLDNKYGYLKRCDVPPSVYLSDEGITFNFDRIHRQRIEDDVRSEDEKRIADLILG